MKILTNKKGSAVMWVMAVMPLMLSVGALAIQRQMDATIKTAQIQKNTMTRNGLVSIKNWLITNSLDADNDGYAELLKEYSGNALPLSCPVKSTDDYGHNYKYETWDLGVANSNSTYSQNAVAPPKVGMIGRVTSTGADGVFGTNDDVVIEIYNSDVQSFKNNSGWQEDVINHKVTQLNDNDQVTMGTQTPDGTAKLTIYNTIAGAVASFGNMANTAGNIILKTGGVIQGILNWNINDSNTATGTAMMLQNLRGKLHLFDSTNSGLTVSNGRIGIQNINPNSTLDVNGTAAFGSTGSQIKIGNVASWGGSQYNSLYSDMGYIMMNAIMHIPYQTYGGDSGSYIRMTDSPGVANYWDAGLFGDIYKIRRNGNMTMQIDNGGNLYSLGAMYPNGQGTYSLYADTGNAGLRTNGNYLVNGNIYWGAGGNWLSAYLNQALLTTSSPTFGDIYSNGWFRNNNSGQGLYNQTNGNHFYSEGSNYWTVTSGSSTTGGIIFRDTYAGTLRGYVYHDASGFGLLHNGGGWSYRTNGATTTIFGSGGNSTGHNYGAIQVQGTKNGWSGINFTDGSTNYGTLMMHPTSGSGFYNAADNGWRWYVDNAGNVTNYGNLTVNGQIQASASGIKFSDGTVQTTAASGTFRGYSFTVNGYAANPMNGIGTFITNAGQSYFTGLVWASGISPVGNTIYCGNNTSMTNTYTHSIVSADGLHYTAIAALLPISTPTLIW